MSVRSFVVASCIAATAACAKSSSPTQPSDSPSGSGSSSSATASVVAPRPFSPANASQVRNADQPVVLTVNNGLVTGNATATYTFEVATDSGFSNKVQVKDAVPQGSNGQTSVRLDTLAPSADYYWHARAQGGGTTGAFSAIYKFSVGPAIVLQPPTPVSPANNATSSGWPTLTVSNSARSGPAGSLVYQFDISASPTFTPILLSGTAAETPTATSFTPPAGTAAPAQRTLYWRAIAIDQTNGALSAPSVPWSFTYTDATRAGQIAVQAGYGNLWPGVQPTGAGGHITWGGGWDVYTAVTNGISHVTPGLDELRVMDLIDRGMDPEAAITWLKSNGYGTAAAWYPAIAVIGFPLDYAFYLNGTWNLNVPAVRG